MSWNTNELDFSTYGEPCYPQIEYTHGARVCIAWDIENVRFVYHFRSFPLASGQRPEVESLLTDYSFRFKLFDCTEQ
jgi:hypothetical protein